MMQRHTMPISIYLKGLYRDLDDLEWNGGRMERRKFLMAEIDRVKQRIKNGATVEPLF